jgi:hypothetical protein
MDEALVLKNIREGLRQLLGAAAGSPSEYESLIQPMLIMNPHRSSQAPETADPLVLASKYKTNQLSEGDERDNWQT